MRKPFPRGSMLRRFRQSMLGTCYCITASTHRREPFFAQPGASQIVVEEIARIEGDLRTVTCAFVVMPDHLHWLFQLCVSPSVPEVVRSLKGRSARRVNLLLGRKGCLWQSGYHDRQIYTEAATRTMANYILHNPVRAGLVRQASDYEWSDLAWNRYRGLAFG